MSKLHIADSFGLPLEFVAQTAALLAKRRAGKSYLAMKLVEQLYHAKQQVVVLDPKGDSWGLRSAAGGEGPGIQIVILGGEHGDVRLESTAGEVVARMVVEERVSAVLDLSEFRKHEVATFCAAFLETLYRLKAREQYRTPVMLVIDEADAVAPQRPQRGEERMLGAAEDIVRRGGQRGIGCIMATQRAAVLNKNVLTQVQVLIALRTIAPQDLDAMNAWIDVHGTPEQRKALMESLPALPVGTAWFWSPGWPTHAGIFQRVQVGKRETFDSGATPEPGKRQVEPRNVADVDLTALQKRMAATIERAKADDPKELHKQIAALKRELQHAQQAKPAAEVRTVEVPVLGADEIHAARQLVECVTALAEKLDNAAMLQHEALASLKTKVIVATEKWGPQALRPIATACPVPARPETRRAVARMAAHVASNNGADLSGLGLCERKILGVLANTPNGCGHGKLALLSGYRFSGGFRNSLSALRTAGLILGGNMEIMRLTEKGAQVAPQFAEHIPSGAERVAYWINHASFGACERAILTVLADVYPKGKSMRDLSEATGYEPSGGFRNALSNLRTAGVIEGRNTEAMRASDELFD